MSWRRARRRSRRSSSCPITTSPAKATPHTRSSSSSTGSSTFTMISSCIRTLRPGDFFGEIGLETSGTRSAHVAARGRVKLAKLMAWDYRAMVERNPVIRDRIAAVIAERSERP